MKHRMFAAAALAAFPSFACAGGIDRSGNDYGLLFTPGQQINMSVARVTPSVSGKYPGRFGGGDTGNMSRSFVSISAIYKADLSDRLAMAVYVNDPYGASSVYRQGFYAGVDADWISRQTAAILRYRIGDRVSVFGGTRYVKSHASIVIPEQLNRAALAVRSSRLVAQSRAAARAGDLATATALGAEAARLGAAANPASNPPGDPGLTYRANSKASGAFGYVAGIAYEIPDIALRASLTWESQIEYAFKTREVLPTIGLDADTTNRITMPQSLSLDLQSGIAPGTMAYGGVKWTEWSKWSVAPDAFTKLTGQEITGFKDDVFTWKLGVARQFSQTVLGFAQMTYEKAHNSPVSNLYPVDGRFGLALGGELTTDSVKLRGGIEYVRLGDATDQFGTRFQNNSALGVGMTFSMTF